MPENTTPEDDRQDPGVEVEAAQREADAGPVKDERTPPEPDEDRNP